MINCNPNCPNKHCEGGVITYDGQTGTICRKCNPLPKGVKVDKVSKKKKQQIEIKKLYNKILAALNYIGTKTPAVVTYLKIQDAATELRDYSLTMIKAKDDNNTETKGAATRKISTVRKKVRSPKQSQEQESPTQE